MSDQAKNKEILCSYCGQPIESRYDLVVRGGFWKMFAIHGSCHSQEIDREKSWGLITNLPTNSSFIKIIAIGYPLFIIAMALLGWLKANFENESGITLLFVSIAFIVLSIRSWWNFERRVPK